MRVPTGIVGLSLIGLGAIPLSGSQPSLSLSVSERARSVQQGEIVRLRLTANRVLEGVEAVNQGRAVGFYRIDDGRTWEALLGIDVTLPPGPQTVEITAREAGNPPRALAHALLVRPKVFPSRRISVAEDFARPPPEVAERVKRESERLTTIFASSSPERLWNQPFSRPVRGRATSAFGRRSIVNGEPRDPHRGTDFRAPLGTTVRSPNDGRVVLAEDLYFAGRTVIVDHGLGLYSLLAHLSAIRVKEGDHVRREEVLGRSGATGRVTAAHLHWAIRLGNASVDPLALLAVTAGKS
jgi:murein DD-endopeptidase MepM/ murein hydrolase activator NlpD